jgi:uncharacterized protein (DUF1499 family)
MSASATGLPPCPESPNCVSSQASDASHRVEPFTFDTRPEVALQRLIQAIESEPRITLVKEEGGYLHAEARSFLFRFVDDIEFMLDANSGLIDVRSASRTGHSDFGVNRRRVERIRRSFNEIP